MVNSISSVNLNSNTSFGAKSAAGMVVDIANELGVNIRTAQKRLFEAKLTKGINVNNPKLMQRAISGEFETPVVQKRKHYICKHHKEEAGTYGIIYADTFMRHGR